MAFGNSIDKRYSLKRMGRQQPGFTLIELVVTVAMIAVLATIALPTAQVTVRRYKEQQLRRALSEIRAAIDAYKAAVEAGLIATKLDETGYPPTLNVLVEGALDRRSPTKRKIFFLRRLPTDPMVETRNGEATASWGIRSYASPPDSPQEGSDVFDVYSKSNAIGMNGIPYRDW